MLIGLFLRGRPKLASLGFMMLPSRDATEKRAERAALASVEILLGLREVGLAGRDCVSLGGGESARRQGEPRGLLQPPSVLPEHEANVDEKDLTSGAEEYSECIVHLTLAHTEDDPEVVVRAHRPRRAGSMERRLYAVPLSRCLLNA